ncbi:MAG: 1-(5-phosphoribosyl)-5-[(5-phosphoribosylamino)methylideneamino]imidazole-4-carboxamide isomerase [Candidatus Marinimicrobia bacterium]|nr:1-(5-phosphoribosyl)-5-[(5-phosphoribosylamino)methylideneamino]imidazole-4-carboxamide isomerase [Candidatus Neomarinimicrobiota bacterium]
MIEIIPAIDIIDGKCVRLTRGDYDTKKIYDADPKSVAERYVAAGLKRLHCVDLDGAKAGRLINDEAIKTICSVKELHVDLGGGIQSDADIRKAFALGAKQITAGSIAAYEPAKVTAWLAEYGSDKIILGADFKHGKIAISGWQESTGFDLMTYLDDYISRGIKTVISTDISRDGMMEGSAEKTYSAIKERYPHLELIASGGISCMDDIRRLDDLNIDAVIVGKAIYEERISMQEIREFIGSC